MSFLFQIVLRPELEGGYTVIVPSLPGCISFGETLEEAKIMAKEAIELYIETLKERKEEVIDDTHTLETRLQVIPLRV
ncbi:antitoxin HicB [Candidatus Peribacteria bacterium RIFCSPLOWO2_01_FULL_51_18]|nr:MAG: antitoxin HicB [Candidatus Peribacteria bacterium RIFCSPHIGHO2_02_FULL_51_15]OGJ66684.1 MAG: antitoxin HicB [Candidatus Peribacteria bacterium RIFCSPLOWO2_01_FULL_51_18]OGJ69788.1 MAG: antitoxin HicB [Candidatus Peribacteria bacterium RIFCSPLOWO2_02_FULL_51_10]